MTLSQVIEKRHLMKNIVHQIYAFQLTKQNISNQFGIQVHIFSMNLISSDYQKGFLNFILKQMAHSIVLKKTLTLVTGYLDFLHPTQLRGNLSLLVP